MSTIHKLLILILFTLNSPGVALSQKANEDQSLPTTAKEEALVLLVNKMSLKAKLLTWPSPGQPGKMLGEFRVAIGKAEGDKQKEGDNKTPEGIYFTEKIIPGYKLPSKYGANAIPLNFPNPIDRLKGKTGHGIWLHGVENNTRIEQAMITEGCVAFYNEDISALAKILTPKQSIVIITSSSSQGQLGASTAAIQKAHSTWFNAWQERDMETYINSYQKDFTFNSMNLKGYRKYKERIFQSYNHITITQSDLKVFIHEDYALSTASQAFYGDSRYKSIGLKHLYWKKTSGNHWEIIFEDFKQRLVKHKTISPQDIRQSLLQSPSRKYWSKIPRLPNDSL